MSDPKKILMLGDTHGFSEHVEWAAAYAERNMADAIFVLGDFGYWEHGDDGAFLDKCSAISSDYGMPIFWLDGNHENHTWLRRKYIDAEAPRDEWGFVKIRPGLYHAPRAHAWEWNGYRFMALGGAYSVDKEGRIVGEDRKRRQARAEISGRKQARAEIPELTRWIAESGEGIFWWEEEEITEAEVALALEVDKVDILLTHDKPLASEPTWNRKNDITSMDNQEKVQRVMDHHQPGLLFHGHLHFPYIDEIMVGFDDDGPIITEVHGLDCNAEAKGQYEMKHYRKEHSVALLELRKGGWTVQRESLEGRP